jgi:predicted O-methyltransferase YrrM
VSLGGPIEQYAAALIGTPDPLLAEMYEHAEEESIPVVEPATGRLLEILATASGAQRAVEVGTAIGVSTLHLARGGAHVTSFEVDELRHQAARGYLSRGGFADRVDLRLQDAGEGLASLDGPFDLAFIDGPKQGYGDHIEQVIALLRPGGVLLVDNVLISGTIVTGVPAGPWTAEHIEAMRALNRRLSTDPRLLSLVTPVGDGVTLAVRR